MSPHRFRSVDNPQKHVVNLRTARIRFALVFALVGGTLLTVYSFPCAEHGIRETELTAFLSAYAHVVGSVLHVLDPTVRVAGVEIAGRTSLTVAKNCDAMDVNILFVAAVVAFPASWRKRFMGAALGLLFLMFVNIGRIVSLYLLAVYGPGSFEFAHAEVWPLLMVVTAAAAFLVWSRWATQLPAARP